MRLDFPATRRNAKAIETVLRDILPKTGLVLEIASGSGQHMARFASVFRHLHWQPSDPDPLHLQSITAWTDTLENVHSPIELDTTESCWPVNNVQIIYCANMVHIAPWEASIGLFKGAEKTLSLGGLLILYGPFKIEGTHIAQSNVDFDRNLKRQDPRWGVRDLGAVRELAKDKSLVFKTKINLPANNLIVIFEKVD